MKIKTLYDVNLVPYYLISLDDSKISLSEIKLLRETLSKSAVQHHIAIHD